LIGGEGMAKKGGFLNTLLKGTKKGAKKELNKEVKKGIRKLAKPSNKKWQY
jgi:hypothetical protein